MIAAYQHALIGQGPSIPDVLQMTWPGMEGPTRCKPCSKVRVADLPRPGKVAALHRPHPGMVGTGWPSARRRVHAHAIRDARPRSQSENSSDPAYQPGMATI